MKNKLVNSCKSFLLFLGITAMSSGVPVSAVTLKYSDLGETFKVKWLLPTDVIGEKRPSIDLSAEAQFTVDKFYTNPENLTRVTLDVTLKNTTKLNGLENADIDRFGFAAATALTSDIDSVEIRDKKDDNGDTDIFLGAKARQEEEKFSGKFPGIDICVFNNLDNRCANDPNANNPDVEDKDVALAAGKFDNFYLDIYGDFTDGVSFSEFPINFQTDEGQFVFEGAEVPEPGMIVALGLFTAGSILLKRKSK